MNRIEIFAQENADVLDLLVFGVSSPLIACTPVIKNFIQAQAANFNSGYPDHLRKEMVDLNGESLTFRELLHALR